MYRNDRIVFASTFFLFCDSCRLYRRFLFDEGRNDSILRLFRSPQITFSPFFFVDSRFLPIFAPMQPEIRGFEVTFFAQLLLESPPRIADRALQVGSLRGHRSHNLLSLRIGAGFPIDCEVCGEP